MKEVFHITMAHNRYDTRIFLKECRSIAKIKDYSVTLLVKDGLPSEEKDKVKILNLSKPPPNRLMRFLSGILSLAVETSKRRPDIVHIHDPELIMLIPLWKALGIYTIFDMHEYVPKDIWTKHYLSGVQKITIGSLYLAFERIALLSEATVFAEHSYSKHYPWLTRSVSVLNYPQISEIPNGSLRKDFTFCYLGGVSHNRGIISALRAIKRLRDNGIPSTFLCIGPIDPKVISDPLFSLALQEKWLEAPGRIPANKAWPRIAKCQIGLAILDREENFTQSYPTKVFEYMAIGIPVITSDFTLYKKVIENTHCGLSVPPESADKIFEAMKRLVTDEDYATKLGENGRQSVSKYFSWSSQENKLLGLYKQLLNEFKQHTLL